MPELPEVTTTVNGINAECTGWTIIDVWTDLAVAKPSRSDFYETIKYLPYFKDFAKNIEGKKIVGAKRRGKNILIELNDGKVILVHMKMTGHMMVGNYEYKKKENSWAVHRDEKNEALKDPFNRFIHVVFTLQKSKKEKQLVLCDTRKFAKVALLQDESHHTKHLGSHGPEPLYPDISYKDFINTLDIAPANKRAIKILLMDTRTIAGIGNIYSDEMLWSSSIHPESRWDKIPAKQKKFLYTSMLSVLKRGIDFGGDSMSDYRNIYGERGQFQNKHNAYRKKGQMCGKKSCSGVIMRIVSGGRSAHFCGVHQKLFT